MIKKLKSRKFWVLVITAALTAAANQLGIDPETVTKIVGLAGTYLLGQGLADAGAGKSQTSDQ